MTKDEYNSLDIPLITTSKIMDQRCMISKQNTITDLFINDLLSRYKEGLIILDKVINIKGNKRVIYKDMPKFQSNCLVHTGYITDKNNNIIFKLEYGINT